MCLWSFRYTEQSENISDPWSDFLLILPSRFKTRPTRRQFLVHPVACIFFFEIRESRFPTARYLNGAVFQCFNNAIAATCLHQEVFTTASLFDQLAFVNSPLRTCESVLAMVTVRRRRTCAPSRKPSRDPYFSILSSTQKGASHSASISANLM